MENSPFNRSARTARSPPPTPGSSAPIPESTPRLEHETVAIEAVSTAEVQNWMTSIDQCLSEVCSISTEGKLNSDQKLRISNLCRKVGHGVSQIAVLYQSLKLKAVQARTSIQTLQEHHDLSQKLQDLKVSIDESSKMPTSASFADMVRKGNNKFVQPSKLSSVAIYPSDKGRTSEDTKNLVQKIISPEELKLHVRGLRKTRNGGVIISTESKQDIDKLKTSQHITNSGLTIDEPQKRRPRIVIVGVPSAMKDTEVLNCLYQQNLADQFPNCSFDKFLTSIKLSHKSGKRDAETCNYIIEVPAKLRKALITKDRVFINWSSCPVRDYTLVTRCYKCQLYGHAAKSCRESSHTCGHCGNQGHSIQECMNKAEEPATCLHFKKSCNHTTGSADCPAKLMAEKKYINSIDYEGA